MILSDDPSIAELSALLTGDGGELFEAAGKTLRNTVGDSVFLRGLVEIDNRCGKNCLYCGLRRENSLLPRYSMSTEEITGSISKGYSAGLRSFLMQSGEICDTSHVNRVLEVLRWCSSEIPDARIVLSLGEFPDGTYDRFREAGASRYLLRIESSSRSLYRKWHPEDHSFQVRLKALEYLRDSGWQTGTGVLIGMPGQTADDLAGDLLFMKNENVDMIGMGPYLESAGTPMGEGGDPPPSRARRKRLTLRMIALARLLMPSVNIAATTALQTIAGDGLELGLKAGANVVMPNLTPARYRASYNLYGGKIQVGDGIGEIMGYLGTVCEKIGRTLNTEDPGDPIHYSERMKSAGSKHCEQRKDRNGSQ